MDDSLERFIKNNKDHIDDLEPGHDNWLRIQRSMEKGRSKPGYNMIWKIAAILFLSISMALWFYQLNEANKNAGPKLSAEFNEVEQFYSTIIQQKKQDLTDFELKEFNHLEQEFLSEVESLDSAYRALKIEFKETASQKIIDALIVNLQTRIELLNQQLDILQKIKSKKKNENIYNI